MDSIQEILQLSKTADGEDLWRAIRTQNPHAMLNATLNVHLNVDMAVYIAKSRAAPSEALGFLAQDIRFKDSYKLKRAICNNPKSPLRITLSILKYLRLFDLADITRNQNLNVVVRQKVEMIIEEKIPAMPSGTRTALSRRACGKIVLKLMEKSEKKVIESCLHSPYLSEEQIVKLIGKQTAKSHMIQTIATHPKWSSRYTVKFALVRNYHTPMTCVVEFITGMKTTDLQYLYIDSKLPVSTRPFIFRELQSRGEPLEPQEEETYVVEEEDLNDLNGI